MRRSTLVSSAVVSLALTAVANATPVTITYNGVSPSATVSLSNNSGSSFSNLSAGLVNLTGAVTNPVDLRGAFTGFCIDFTQAISGGHTYTDFNTATLASAPIPGSGMGATKADQISQLWYNERSGLSTANDYAAFQVSIWEIINDSGLSLTAGTFREGSGTVRTLAQTMLNKLGGTGGRTSLYAIVSSSVQDFVVPSPAVPAPGAAGLAVLGFGMAVRRNRRK